MLFFVWYDDNPKKPVVEKIHEAMAAYTERFKARPSLLLVNETDYVGLPDLLVRSERTVQPNTFWLGREDDSTHPAL
jgi:hypothetical protein